MVRSSPSKRINATAIDGDMVNKRPRASGEKVAIRPNKPTASSSHADTKSPRVNIENDSKKENLASIKTKTSRPSPKPSESLQQPQIQDWDNDGDSVTVVDPDAPELIGYDYESEDSRESSSDEEDGDDTTLLIREGPYAHSIFQLRQESRSRFPIAMMVKLETNRLRTLNKFSALMPPLYDGMGFLIIHMWDELPSSNGVTGERVWEVVGIARSLEKANTVAMSFFCKKYREHTCRVDEIGNSRQNRKKSPFMKIEDYENEESFEKFHHTSGTKDCSAWGIDPKGCLGLLAVRGMMHFGMVYVLDANYFD
ncbi:hypothetical protein F4781DRAFT_383069 [Annulohypoxylon bovei var. microspora]|nr:hypothetical protein F4781DRAFT_383069 [Annulohypoxylon bovei var. microspora]